jgi:xylan 1,4-beta-xylosidase
MWNRREFTAASASALAATALATRAQAQSGLPIVNVHVDLHGDAGPLEHKWSRCAGSDRAEITMREGWRSDARRFRKEAGLESVRFHGILDDEMGVWPQGFVPLPQPNFQNVDNVYDGLMSLGLDPWVEISFMPSKLASGKSLFPGYTGNITPPKSLTDWGAFIRLFAQHLIGRYGAPEVRKWNFEVWNEPNLGFFFAGTQAQYFDFYRATALALKAVDPALKVGGPSTSAVQWIPEFLDYCSTSNTPIDFVSTHVYAGDDQTKIFGEAAKFSQTDVIPAAVEQVRGQIDASSFKGIPFWLSEWSSDSPAMIASVVTRCLPYCNGLSHWELSGVFEEVFIPSNILVDGSNGWGMFAPRNIPMPAFNTYKLMNRLGHTRLSAEGPALASKRDDGKAAILVWNLAEVAQAKGLPGAVIARKVVGERKRIAVALKGAHPGQRVQVSYVDWTRGSPMPAWHALGSPQYMTQVQLAHVRASAEIAAPEMRKLDAKSSLALDLPAEGVALIELI